MTLTQVKPAGLSKPVDLADDEKIRLGTGNDLQIYHSSAGGGSSFIDTAGSLQIHTSELYINNEANTERMIRCVQDGVVELYHNGTKKLETSSSGVEVTGNITGSGSLSADGFSTTGGEIALTGTVPRINLIDSNANSDFRLKCDGGNFHIEDITNNGNRLSISSSGDVIIHNDLDFPDNSKIKLGSGDDLEIFHNASQNIIGNTATQLRLITDQLRFRSYTGSETYAQANVNGAFELFHNNSKKLETTSGGATVLGNLTASNVLLSSSTSVLRWPQNSGSNLSRTWDIIGEQGGYGFLEVKYASAYNGSADEKSIRFNANDAVYLYFDNTKRLETLSNGVRVINQLYNSESVINLEKAGCHHHRIIGNDTGNDLGFQQSSDFGSNTNFTTYLRINDGGDISLPVDNQKLKIGAGGDLKIYHDGTENIYQSNGLKNHVFKPKDTDVGLKIIGDGGVELYYDNSKKLATESTGVAIEGKMHSGHDMPNVGQTSFHTVDQAIIGTKHVLTAYHNSTSTTNSPLALNSVIPTNSAGEITIIAGWSNGNGLRIRKFAYVASGNTSVTEIYNHFNSRYGVSVSISTPTPSISGDYVNFSIGFSDSQGAKIEKLKVHVEYFKQFNI